MSDPFPEEANRRLTTVLSTIHFAPTLLSKAYLNLENIHDRQIVVTGNTVVDALNIFLKQPFSFSNSLLKDIPFDKYRTVLVTSHRRETQEKGLLEICRAVRDLAHK